MVPDHRALAEVFKISKTGRDAIIARTIKGKALALWKTSLSGL
jgi:hypothetical protein